MAESEYYRELAQWFLRLWPLAAITAVLTVAFVLWSSRRIRNRSLRAGARVLSVVAAIPLGFALSLIVHNLAKPA